MPPGARLPPAKLLVEVDQGKASAFAKAFAGRRSGGATTAARARIGASMSEANPYDDSARAAAYARLGIVNTYYLAYRDLPALFAAHRVAGRALDFGCGTGRSTRFLRDHGFAAVGVDISEAMIARAKDTDPGGDYRVIAPGDLAGFGDGTFDLALSEMPFDSIATGEEKARTLREISRVLKPGGVKILVAASRDVYLREWVSWSSRDFPENRQARSGDRVRLVINDLGDDRIVTDTLWTEDAYRETFAATPLRLVETLRPVVRPDDTYRCDWISERTHAPFVIFVLEKPATAPAR
jgi:SAM-dependent methyltransferase